MSGGVGIPTYAELFAWVSEFFCDDAPNRCGTCLPCRVEAARIAARPRRGAIVRVVHEFEAQYLRTKKGIVVLGDSIPDDPVPVEYDSLVIKMVVSR